MVTVRYILGRAGCGKSQYIMEEIRNDLNNGDSYPLILLVPEQYTLQAERDLISRLLIVEENVSSIDSPQNYMINATFAPLSRCLTIPKTSYIFSIILSLIKNAHHFFQRALLFKFLSFALLR